MGSTPKHLRSIITYLFPRWIALPKAKFERSLPTSFRFSSFRIVKVYILSARLALTDELKLEAIIYIYMQYPDTPMYAIYAYIGVVYM